MKKYLLLIVLLFAGSQFVSAQTLKLGYVDSQVILNQYSAAIKAQEDLDAITAKWSAQVDSMTQAYQQELANYQKQAQTMPEDQQLAAQQKLIKMEQDILDFRRQKFGNQGEIYQKQEEIFSPIKDRIYDAIAKVAKDEGMQFVFDKSGDIVLLYADDSFDITYKVLDLLKRNNK